MRARFARWKRGSGAAVHAAGDQALAAGAALKGTFGNTFPFARLRQTWEVTPHQEAFTELGEGQGETDFSAVVVLRSRVDRGGGLLRPLGGRRLDEQPL